VSTFRSKRKEDVWDTSCVDWRDRLVRGDSLMPRLSLVESQSIRAVAIFDRLRLPDVPGQPHMREAVGPWFREIVAAVFGTWHPALRARFVREFFLLVPKKNSKTTGGAALMLVATLMTDRPHAEFLIVAPTHEIAELAFSQAVGMIEADPVLRAKCHVIPHRKTIEVRSTKAFLKIKSFDPKVVTGSKPSGVLLDEVHVIAEAPQADRVIGQLRGGLISQPDGFLIQITTQSERPPSGVFLAELTKARNVRDGKLRAPILPILYEFPSDIDWRDARHWHMVNPNDGRSLSIARLIPDYEQAVASGEGELRRWASQHLNIEVGVALKVDTWPGALTWQQCARPAFTLADMLDTCDAFAIGIDAGGPEDMLGLCVLGREYDTRTWVAWVHAWIHRSALERYPSEAQRWLDFEREGSLTIVDELGPDVDEVVDVCDQVQSTGRLSRIGMDPARGAKVLHDALTAGGIDEQLFAGVGQGWRLTGVIALVERRLMSRTLAHADTALMRYCCGNARIVPKGNATLITKEASAGKIDPLMALFDAAECLALAPPPVDVDALIAPPA
jgi:phage terminase large subunit-like protein